MELSWTCGVLTHPPLVPIVSCLKCLIFQGATSAIPFLLQLYESASATISAIPSGSPRCTSREYTSSFLSLSLSTPARKFPSLLSVSCVNATLHNVPLVSGWACLPTLLEVREDS